ncbi:MAG TPA: hypothetical protein VHA11_00340 [Bryobacteraceae bacterium]|nr:hypothetical protein [Bryobacteraceae bacterium]
MFYRKNRTISVRLSEQEYDELRQVSEASGSPSVSEYMRARIFEALRPPAGEPSIGGLASDVAELRTRFERLCAHVGLEEKE